MLCFCLYWTVNVDRQETLREGEKYEKQQRSAAEIKMGKLHLYGTSLKVLVSQKPLRAFNHDIFAGSNKGMNIMHVLPTANVVQCKF